MTPRFYVQWATVCWQVRDGETHTACGFHKARGAALRQAKALNAEKPAPPK